MTIREEVARYLGIGFSVVPLEPRSKRPLISNWPGRTFTADDFLPESNVGLKSVNGLVVLDDDFPMSAATCMDAFLPPTGAIYGRPGRERSKRLYTCADLTDCVTFKDIDNLKHLLQLRVGLQDMAPPSLHPDTGERLSWVGELQPPAAVTATQLINATRHAWTARLIAKYWPAEGRHDLRLAFARVLLETLGLSVPDARSILEMACRLGGSDDDGVADAGDAIDSTNRKLHSSEKASGGGTISRLMQDGDVGRRLVRQLREAYDKNDEVADAVERLNDKFAVVSVGNKVVVMEMAADGGPKNLWPPQEFRNLVAKQHVQIGDKQRALGDVWLKHPAGLQYGRLVYVMPGSRQKLEPDDYNGWRGFTVQPTLGDWSKNHAHLRDIICGGNNEHFAWVFNWCAALVQQPGRHAFAAVVLRGQQGTGKGHFVDKMLGALFQPQQYIHILGADQLTTRFNEHLSGKVLVFADESTWGGDVRAADRLKGLITESTVIIERKFLPPVEEPSALHIVMASNNDWPVSIPLDDRRYMVLDVSSAKRQDDAYFAELHQELRDGGLAAMLYDLMAHTVDDKALRHPVTTAAKRAVALQSLKPIERWWFERLTAGGLPVNRDWPKAILKSQVLDDFFEYLDRHERAGASRRANETELGTFLRPYTTGQRMAVGGKREQFFIFNSLAECRAAWLRLSEWDTDYVWEAGDVG